MAPAEEQIEIPPSADTAIMETDPTYNLGRQRDVPAGTLGVQAEPPLAITRAFFRFDLSAIPAGSVITGASIRMYLTKAPDSAASSTFAFHRMLRDWGEGSGFGDNPGGEPAQAGEASWNSPGAGAPWDQPGATVGEDCAAAPSAQRGIAGLGEYTFPLSAAGVAELQAMRDGAMENFGYLFRSMAEQTAFTGRRWATREHRTDPPALAVTYEPPPSILPGTRIDAETGEVVIPYEAEMGFAYVLQSRAELGSGDWATAAESPPADATEPAEFRVPMPEGRAFYRVGKVVPQIP